LTIGCRRAASNAALATRSSGEIRTSRQSGSARSRSIARIVRVMSTVRNTVTCGAVNADATMFSAVSLRTPLTGMRCSRSPAGIATTGATAEAAPPFWADSTSSRVIEPSGPDPVSVPRSTPRSLASLRTGGLASATWSRRPASGATAGTSTGWTGAGTTGSGACAGATGAGAAAGSCAAATGAPSALRGRRFAAAVLGP
jgi:hypothetical protein